MKDRRLLKWNMKKSGYIVGIFIAMLAILLLPACGKRTEGPTVEELQQENAIMAEIIREDEEKIAALEQTIAAINGGEIKTSIGYVASGSGDMTFYTINDKVLFTTPLEFKGALPAPSTSKLNITDRVTLVPSSNWLIKMYGSSAEFNHPSGISGTIQVGTIKETVAPDKMEEVIFRPFLANVPNSGIVYGDIFVNDRSWGKYANVQTTVNEEPATLKLGAVGFGETSIIYTFIYGGKEDITKDELIETMLKTMKINGQNVGYN